ncbi:hypothetical protein ABPG74_005397 [Tetrahymena malaccensis]
MRKFLQPQNFQKKCTSHANRDILYLQIGQKKQQQIGACLECVTSNELQGQHLMLVSDILQMQSIDNPISKSYPILQEKKLLTNIQQEYLQQQQYKDPLQEIKNFLGELKNKIIASIENIEQSIQQNAQQHFVSKIDLLKSYEQISQKGQFLALFNDYMSDSTNNGSNLSYFLTELNKKQQQNTMDLKAKLENFHKTQNFIKQQQSIQQTIFNFSTFFIEMVGKTLTFDNKNDCFYQQVENNLDKIHNQLEILKSLLLPNYIIKNDNNQKKETIDQFIQQNQKDFSQELQKLIKSVLIQEARLNKNLKENVNQQKISQIEENIKQFNKNLQYMMNLYSFDVSNKFHITNNLAFNYNKSCQLIPIIPNSIQVISMIQNNNTLMKCLNQDSYSEIYHQQSIKANQIYKIQLEFKPFQNQESRYTFCVGLKQYNQQQQQQNSVQQVQQLFFSNCAVEGRLSTKTEKGIHIIDQEISHSGQMRTLEIQFCLQKKMFTLSDFPKRENVIVAQDQRLDQIDLSQKYFFFIKTLRIQEINLIEFTQNPQM